MLTKFQLVGLARLVEEILLEELTELSDFMKTSDELAWFRLLVSTVEKKTKAVVQRLEGFDMEAYRELIDLWMLFENTVMPYTEGLDEYPPTVKAIEIYVRSVGSAFHVVAGLFECILARLGQEVKTYTLSLQDQVNARVTELYAAQGLWNIPDIPDKPLQLEHATQMWIWTTAMSHYLKAVGGVPGHYKILLYCFVQCERSYLWLNHVEIS
jgi:hypothetical protein